MPKRIANIYSIARACVIKNVFVNLLLANAAHFWQMDLDWVSYSIPYFYYLAKYTHYTSSIVVWFQSGRLSKTFCTLKCHHQPCLETDDYFKAFQDLLHKRCQKDGTNILLIHKKRQTFVPGGVSFIDQLQKWNSMEFLHFHWKSAAYWVELQTIHRFSQSRRRPLLGPSPGWKRLLVLSHLRHY